MSWKSDKVKPASEGPPVLKETPPPPPLEEWTADIEVDGGHVRALKRFESKAAAVAYVKAALLEGVHTENEAGSLQFFAPSRIGGAVVSLKP